MKKTLMASAFLAILLLPGCEGFSLQGASAQRVLSTLCSLKQTELFQLWTTQQQRDAGRIVCAAIGMSEGTP